MWSSITEFHRPDTIHEAWQLLHQNSAELLAGGTYLVAQKETTISSLVNINPLLNNQIKIDSDLVTIGAGATLQQLYSGKGLGLISESAFNSCPSRNIRNQRTIGGELARMRLNSELVCLMYSLGVEITVYKGEEITCPLIEWDGTGIITTIQISSKRLSSAAQERFSVLPTAPAFLILTGVQDENEVQITVGGKKSELSFGLINSTDFKGSQFATLMSSLNPKFEKDQYGSKEYKMKLLETALNRIQEKLCR